jgi:hypothetical protein
MICILELLHPRSAEDQETSNNEGKTFHSASLNKPHDMIHNETSYWTDEKILRLLHDIYFSVVETFQ